MSDFFSKFRSRGSKKGDNEKLYDGESSGYPSALPPMRMPSVSRMEKYLDAAAEQASGYNKDAGKCLTICKPVFLVVIKGVLMVAPIYKWMFDWCVALYHILPANIISMVFGIALCFFGGTYVASISAIEAWRQMGFQRALADLTIINAEWKKVEAANTKDDAKDDDHDGVPDVDQIPPNELARRKISLAMVTVENPQQLQSAVGSLWAGYLAVLATLRLEFARTTALALGIVEMAKVPITKLLAPVLINLLGKDLKHWAITIIESTLAFIAIVFAWYLQMIISAFYSAIRGGRLFAQGLFNICNERGWIEKLPFIAKPYDPDTTLVDDAVGYLVAAGGFIFQITHGFALPFPINLVFLPLTIIEWFLRFQISMEGVH